MLRGGEGASGRAGDPLSEAVLDAAYPPGDAIPDGRGRDSGCPLPPHRSVRAAFPHTAPNLDEWRKSRRPDAPPPAPGTCVGRTVSVACAGSSPWSQGLPSRLSAIGCPPLFEPFIGTTPESDSWPACLWVFRPWPSPTGLPPNCAADTDQVSRFSGMMFPDVRGVFVLAPPFVWSSPFVIGSTPWTFFFHSSIPGLSVPLSTLRLQPLDSRCKTPGQDGSLVFSCNVRLFHSRHHAGLSRRTAKPIPGGFGGRCAFGVPPPGPVGRRNAPGKISR